MNKKVVLITGVAGFIGYHLANRLLSENYVVIGIDNMNAYYDLHLKVDRVMELTKHENKRDFLFIEQDIVDIKIDDLIKNHSINIDRFDYVINLAGQAGVRYSFDNPKEYFRSNVDGFYNILSESIMNKVGHFIYASSSSVYGNVEGKSKETDIVDSQESLYACTKRMNELLAETESKHCDLLMTGLRFFTVYGEYGRPDMAPYIFTNAIMRGNTFRVNNNGMMKRDFTYISDVIDNILLILKNDNEYMIRGQHEVYNICGSKPVDLSKFIDCIEFYTGKSANVEFVGMQKGDVVSTYGDNDKFVGTYGFTKPTHISSGMKKYVEWFKKYYNL